MKREFAWIERIRRAQPPAGAHVAVDIGDDAAVLRPDPGGIVVTVDAAIEGVHFRRSFADVRTLATRAALAAVSDLAAMGAEARGWVSSLVLPTTTTDAEIDELAASAREVTERVGAPLIGGNLARGDALAFTTTWIGAARGPVLRRTGAQLGDRIFVTGVVGARAIGLRALLAGDRSALLAPFIDRWRHLDVRLGDARAIAAGATSAIDVSDGLAADLSHIAAASHVGLRVDLERVPVAPASHEAAQQLGVDLDALVLGGGEDYELVFTWPNGRPAPPVGTCIGVVVDSSAGCQLVGRDKTLRRLDAYGHDHFE